MEEKTTLQLRREKIKTRRVLSFTLSLIILIMAFPISAMAQDPNEVIEFDLDVSDDITVNVAMPREYLGEMSEQELLDIAINEDLQDGERINIHHVGYAEQGSGCSPRGLYTFQTNLTKSGSEWAAQNFFIISVAKGATKTLQAALTQKLSIGITAGTPYSITAELDYSVSAYYSVTLQWKGPPEGSPYNSREYRVQFYAQTYRWVQDRYLVGVHAGQVSGTLNKPTRYAEYSIDRTI